MRYIFTGRTVTPLSMPDPDARDSYFDGCTLTGDFSVFDFRNASFFNCILTGDFRGVIAYATSVSCDWTQAMLPSNFSAHKHDLIHAVVAQKIPTLTGKRKEAAQRIATFIRHNYAVSWENCFRQLRDAGYTLDQIRTHFLVIFQGYPLLINTLERKIARGKLDFTWAATNAPLRVGDTEIDLISDVRLAGREDRWAIERDLEIPGWRVHLIGTRPYPHGLAVEEARLPERVGRWDWWAGLGGAA